MFSGIGIVILLLLSLAAMSIKVVTEYDRAVVFRLGRVLGGEKGPGIIILIPLQLYIGKINGGILKDINVYKDQRVKLCT